MTTVHCAAVSTNTPVQQLKEIYQLVVPLNVEILNTYEPCTRRNTRIIEVAEVLEPPPVVRLSQYSRPTPRKHGIEPELPFEPTRSGSLQFTTVVVPCR